ncbi:MAG TPA: SRPBCC family protein [Burkholderiaceae bacterium]|nr:SRPBCC family protein [Burkholderiaceae bacterium]
MKWLLRIAVGLVGLLVVLAGIGLLLPSQFKVERSVQIAAPADRVYALIADPREWKRWTVWNRRDPAMKMEYGGAPAGAGAKWSWQSGSEGSGNMEFTEAKPGERIAYRLSFPEFGMQSSGLLTIVPTGDGVRVTWTNEGDMGASPVSRWFGLFMDRLVGPDFEGGLANLKRLAEGA